MTVRCLTRARGESASGGGAGAAKHGEAGIHEILPLGPKLRVVSGEPLPESRQMRLKRVYPGSTHTQPKGLSTWLTLVPRPKTLPVGGVDLIDGPMLEWCSKFINSIYSADPKALEES